MRHFLLIFALIISNNSLASSKDGWSTYKTYDREGKVVHGPFDSYRKPTIEEIISDCDTFYGPYSIKIVNQNTKKAETFICDDFFPTEKN